MAERLVAAAWARLATEHWLIRPRPDGWHPQLALQPGAEWLLDEGVFAGNAGGFVITGGSAYLLGGLWQASVLGWSRPVAAIEAVVRGRWLECEETAFRRAGADHGVLPQLAKTVLGSAPVVLARRQAPAGELVRLAVDGAVLEILDDVGGPRLVGLGPSAAHSVPSQPVLTELTELTADVEYVEQPAPDVHPLGTIALADALAQLAARRRIPRNRPRTAVVVRPPAAGETSWTVAIETPGARTGFDLEELAREALGSRAPELLAVVEFDSHAESFLAFVPDEPRARQLAELLR